MVSKRGQEKRSALLILITSLPEELIKEKNDNDKEMDSCALFIAPARRRFRL
jgi:hypothetical protein